MSGNEGGGDGGVYQDDANQKQSTVVVPKKESIFWNSINRFPLIPENTH